MGLTNPCIYHSKAAGLKVRYSTIWVANTAEAEFSRRLNVLCFSVHCPAISPIVMSHGSRNQGVGMGMELLLTTPRDPLANVCFLFAQFYALLA